MSENTTQQSFDAPAYTARGTARARVRLPEAVFDGTVNMPVMHQAVKAFLANQRQANAHTKTRGLVIGGNKKPWKQKGTGRARQGSIRAPHHVGGGRAHPPRPRDWSYRPPRKVRAGALKSALSLFVKEGRLIVVDSFALDAIKTKGVVTAFGALQATKKTLVVDGRDNEKLRLSMRNLPDALFLPPEGVNVYDLLRHDHLVLSRDAVKALEARCLRQPGDGSAEVKEAAE